MIRLVFLVILFFPAVVQAQSEAILPYITQYIRGLLNDPNARIARDTLQLGTIHDPNFAGLNIDSGGNWSIIYLDAIIGGSVSYKVNGVLTWDFYQNGDNIAYYSYVYGGNVLSIDDEGFVGVRTTDPQVPLDVNSNSIRIQTAKTPATATAAGNQGEIAWDTNYLYVCVAANTWKRTALSTWAAGIDFLLLETGDFFLLESGDRMYLE